MELVFRESLLKFMKATREGSLILQSTKAIRFMSQSLAKKKPVIGAS